MKNEKIPDRSEIPLEHCWDLTPLFQSEDDWEGLFSRISNRIEQYDQFKGTLGTSADRLSEALDFHMSLLRDVENLYTYAHLKSDEDKSNSRYLGMQDRAVGLITRISERSSFLTPEIQSIDDAVMQGFKEADRLSTYGFFLEKIIRSKPHTRTDEIERLLAMAQEIGRAPSQIFGQLDNVDLSFGVIEDDRGNPVELSHGNFISFLMKPQRGLRQKAFFQFYAAYRDHKHSIAAALAHSVKKDLFYAKARLFETCRRAALFPDNVPESVYDNLVTAVKENLEPLFHYFEIRKKALGVEALHFYDTYVPLASDIDFNMPYEQAVETAVEALAPLGGEYTGIMREGLVGGWVDRYENKGKRSGAYSSGSFDSPPYILLNYRDDNLNSLYTLVHEAGHSMHSYYSRKNQPYVDYEYTIFAAEVASTFNEVLLSRHLLDRYRNDPGMTAYILNREIDNIRATLFRQTMFAEFESIIHAEAENQQPLTVDVLTRIYSGLLETYFGGTMTVDPELHLECLRIPHFYSAFYVYKYATGISAAVALARRVMAEGDKARDAYLNFLKLGGSMFPLDALKSAGVDMASPEPIHRAAVYFAELVERLDAVTEKKSDRPM